MKIGLFVLFLVIYYFAVVSAHLIFKYRYVWCKNFKCFECKNIYCGFNLKKRNDIILNLLVESANSYNLNVYAVRWMGIYGYVVFKNGDVVYKAINAPFVDVAHFLLDEIRENFELEIQID
ncbi:MAG: hypothetical protein IJ429_02110 [Lachnospiraceae bacterium]|nr:hypothetical protein [Lachnospiraceae bacterium]